jgi:hypothetical protein
MGESVSKDILDFESSLKGRQGNDEKTVEKFCRLPKPFSKLLCSFYQAVGS